MCAGGWWAGGCGEHVQSESACVEAGRRRVEACGGGLDGAGDAANCGGGKWKAGKKIMYLII